MITSFFSVLPNILTKNRKSSPFGSQAAHCETHLVEVDDAPGPFTDNSGNPVKIMVGIVSAVFIIIIIIFHSI